MGDSAFPRQFDQADPPQPAFSNPGRPEPMMSQDRSLVARRSVKITNFLGLHLRPANKFVTTADRFECEIRVHFRGKDFDGKSILDLTSLAAEQGSRLDLEAWGPDAEAALAALAELVANQFNENDNGEELPAVKPTTLHDAADPGSNNKPAPDSGSQPGPTDQPADY